jgi:hypothetical protein
MIDQVEMQTALEHLFECHWPDGSSALKRFRERLAMVQLDFDVEARINVLAWPPQASFPHGVPPFVHYYIYGTPFGTVKKLPVAATDPAHAFSSDGIGLNQGGPIRATLRLPWANISRSDGALIC